jgi:hypothetical protein
MDTFDYFILILKVLIGIATVNVLFMLYLLVRSWIDKTDLK